MKRQLGPILVVLALFCAPAVWSQSGSTDSSQSGSTDSSQSSSTDSSSTAPANNSPSGTSSSGTSSSGTSTSPLFTGPLQTSTSSSTQDNSGQSGGVGGGGALGGSSDDTSQQAGNGPQPVFTHPEQLPPLSMMNEVGSNTGLRMTLSAGASADSNASGGPGTNWLGLGLFQGTLGITQIRPKASWNFNYGGGTNVQLGGGSYYNSVSQVGQAGILWQISQRWQLTLNDSFYYTDDPFQPYLTVNYMPTFNNPNPTIYIPQATTTGNTGTADLSYVLSAHDTLDFSGFQNFLRYQQTIQSLQNSFMWAGAGFYQHQFSARLGIGGGYEFSALDFGHGQSRAGVQTFEGFVSYKISPSMSISGWMGPEYTNTKDLVPVFCFPGYGCIFQVIHQSSWDVAEGATFNYSRLRDAAHVKFSHRVTNGGGLLGAVELYIVDMGYRRILNPRWVFSVSALYGNNLSISHFHLDQYLNSLTGQIGLARNINQSWSANIFYALIDQRQKNVPGYTTPSWLDNRIAVSIQYSWGHSLGR